MYSGDATVWLTLSVTGALDTANTEPAWAGLSCRLPSIFKVMSDKEYVSGHKEIKWSYVSDETGMITEQYGIDGLSPTETVNALAIAIEKDKRHILRLAIENKVLFLLIVLIVVYLIKKR